MSAKRRAAAALAAAAALFLAGCSAADVHGNPLDKAGSPVSDKSSGPGAGEGDNGDNKDLAKGKKESGLRGFTLPAWNTEDYKNPRAKTYLRDIAATGARWVTFTPTWYQDTISDSSMHTTEETADDDSLRHIIRLAHSVGLKTMVKPHVDRKDGGDRAEIKPAHPDAWFAAYERFITHYAKLAKDNGVEQFSVGTELAGTSRDGKHWGKVIKAIRSVYKGPLTYAANYDDYQNIQFWKDLDVIGIDAYFPLGEKPTSDTAALRRAWQPITKELAAFSAKQKRKILFTEAGYVSQHGTITAPYSWTVSKRKDNAEQAAAFEALLATFDGKPWWAGVCWWMWDDWPDTGETPKELAYTPHGKPAERVVRRWWGK